MNDASTRLSRRQDEQSGTFMSAAMSFTYTFRRSSRISHSLVLRYSFRMDTDRKLMLAAVLSFLFTQAVYSAPFRCDSDVSTLKTPTISNVVSPSSSSTIFPTWDTSDDASSLLACGTR